MEASMPETIEKQIPHWSLYADSLELEANNLGCVTKLLHEKISAQRPNEPLSVEDRAGVYWMINQIFSLQDRLQSQAELARWRHHRSQEKALPEDLTQPTSELGEIGIADEINRIAHRATVLRLAVIGNEACDDEGIKNALAQEAQALHDDLRCLSHSVHPVNYEETIATIHRLADAEADRVTDRAAE